MYLSIFHALDSFLLKKWKRDTQICLRLKWDFRKSGNQKKNINHISIDYRF